MENTPLPEVLCEVIVEPGHFLLFFVKVDKYDTVCMVVGVTTPSIRVLLQHTYLPNNSLNPPQHIARTVRLEHAFIRDQVLW